VISKYHLTIPEEAHFFSRKRHVMRPFAIEIAASDYAFAAVIAVSCGSSFLRASFGLA
jgi:hypothetical protein